MAYNRTQVSHGEGVDLTHGGPEAPLAGEGVEGEQRVARHGEDELRQREVHQQPVERGPQLHTQIEIEISFELVIDLSLYFVATKTKSSFSTNTIN